MNFKRFLKFYAYTVLKKKMINAIITKFIFSSNNLDTHRCVVKK